MGKFCSLLNTKKLTADNLPTTERGTPVIADNAQVGQLCVFAMEDGWKIGKVLHKGAQKYKGMIAEISDNSIGVLCSWYVPTKESPSLFRLDQQETIFSYFPLSSYLCTLQGGLEIIDANDPSVSLATPSSIICKNTTSKICQAKTLLLTMKSKL